MGSGRVSMMWGLRRKRKWREGELPFPVIVEPIWSTIDMGFLVTENYTETTSSAISIICYNTHSKIILLQNSTTWKFLNEICSGPEAQQIQGIW